MTLQDRSLKKLFNNNVAWAERIRAQQPDFFAQLAKQQSPEYLWIGCSDSRVPANEIVGLMPGEVFVHRNIANVVVHTDLNCLSVIQFAVDVLKVKHIMVVGHYGCGGVRAALFGDRLGLVDNWLHHVHDVRDKHLEALQKIGLSDARANRLCELNVVEQVINVCQTTILRDAWDDDQEVTVHGWIYGLQDGQLRDLNVTISAREEASSICTAALNAIKAQL
jgi:carbonic anhydrase